MKQILKKLYNYVFGGTLISSAVISAGVLSFTGIIAFMIATFPLTPFNIVAAIAIGAFAFAGLVEIQVYKENIFEGLEKLLTPLNHLKNKIILKVLDEISEDESKRNQASFLQQYYMQKEFLKTLSKKKLSAEQQVIKKTAKENLVATQKLFINFVLNNTNTIELSNVISDEEKSDLSDTVKTRNYLLAGATLLNIAGGVSCAFVTAAGLKIAAITLGTYFGLSLPVLTLSITIWAIAAVAAIAYVVLIHNTVTDILAKKSVRDWFNKQLECFKREENEHIARYVLRTIAKSLLLAIVIGTGVFATLATAGTWWYLMDKLPVVVSAITIGANTVTTLIFNLKNSLKSFTNFIKKFTFQKLFSHISTNIQETKSKENWGQFLNPFRLIIKTIEFPYQAAIFLGHIASVGAGSDQFANVPPLATGIISAASEGLQDLPYMSSGNSNDKHSHSDVPTVLLKIILAPIYFLSGTYAFFTSHFNSQTEHKLSFKQSLMTSFGIKPKEKLAQLEAPAPVNNGPYYLILLKLDERINALKKASTTDALAIEKCALMEDFRKDLANTLFAAPTHSTAATDVSVSANTKQLDIQSNDSHDDFIAPTEPKNAIFEEVINKHINVDNETTYSRARPNFFGYTPEQTTTAKVMEEITQIHRAACAA